ncbi:MAG: hypothetical protein J6R88_02005 [Clostridia bacterium]|nr:hypothetical protein [Clostridia bacterium]
MSELIITESSLRKSNLTYLYSALSEIINQVDARVDIKNGKNRTELKISIPDEYKNVFLTETEDKIADVIVINYKYKHFKKNISISGLSSAEKELLYVALISADFDDDKKYVIKKLRAFKEYTIDGIYNFRLKPLKEKWNEIISYIPSAFGPSGLREFISYLIKDKVGKKVFYEHGKVYDKHYNELKRVDLIENSNDLTVVKEILLSGAGEVELVSSLPPVDEKYVKEFFQDKLRFSTEYYS